MAWQPPASDAVDTGWQPPASDAVASDPGSSWDVTKAAIGGVSQMEPWNILRSKTIQPLGEQVAETGGKLGYPNTGAVAGTAIAISPEILSAFTGLKGLYNSPNPIARGITNTPQEIGQQMQAGEQAAGVSNQLPVRSGLSARFPKTSPDVMTVTPEGTAIPGGTPMAQVPGVTPNSYPKNTNALLNFMKQRLDQGNLSAQELADYKRILPEMFNKMEVARGTPQYAMASDLNSKIADLYNKAIPGRESLNSAYSISKKLHPEVANWLANYVQKYGKSALKEAIGVAIGGGIASRFFK